MSKVLIMTESEKYAVMKNYLPRISFIFLLVFYSLCFLVSFLAVKYFLDMKYKGILKT